MRACNAHTAVHACGTCLCRHSRAWQRTCHARMSHTQLVPQHQLQDQHRHRRPWRLGLLHLRLVRHVVPHHVRHVNGVPARGGSRCAVHEPRRHVLRLDASGDHLNRHRDGESDASDQRLCIRPLLLQPLRQPAILRLRRKCWHRARRVRVVAVSTAVAPKAAVPAAASASTAAATPAAAVTATASSPAAARHDSSSSTPFAAAATSATQAVAAPFSPAAVSSRQPFASLSARTLPPSA